MTATIKNIGSSQRVMSVDEAAYLAGFFDGEGTLTIGRAKRVESRAGFSYEAIMTVGNTDMEALNAVLAMSGNGKIQLSDKRKVLGHKPMYRVLFSANQIRHVLPQIRPYLRVKARQADIITTFLASKVGGKNVTPDLWQLWEDLRAEVRALNLRGIKDTDAETLIVRETRVRVPGPQRLCVVDGCGRRHLSHGYCGMHRYRFLLKGEPARYEKSCEVCATPFVATRKHSRHCSQKCRDRAYYQRNSERIKASVAASKARRRVGAT